MTSTIQFWMEIMLNNILPKVDDQYNPILDGYYTNQHTSNPYNSFVDGYYAK